MYSSDMQSHDHVTTYWPRCSTVRLQGNHLIYAVDWKHSYDLADNRAQLHIRFLNLKTDQDLVGFVRTWGPLWQVTLTNTGEKEMSVVRSTCWAFQRKLKAELGLAQNGRFNDAAGLKAAILEYVAADDECYQQGPIGKPGEAGSAAFFLSLLYSRCTGIDVSRPKVPHPKEWIPKAPLSVLRSVAAHCLPGSFSFALHAAWKGGRLHYSWKPDEFLNLEQAIEMELFNDLIGVRPVTICDECRTVFLPESAHLRKFCSRRCAHRVAMRMWRKKNTEGQHKRKRGKDAKAKKA